MIETIFIELNNMERDPIFANEGKIIQLWIFNGIVIFGNAFAVVSVVQ